MNTKDERISLLQFASNSSTTSYHSWTTIRPKCYTIFINPIPIGQVPFLKIKKWSQHFFYPHASQANLFFVIGNISFKKSFKHNHMSNCTYISILINHQAKGCQISKYIKIFLQHFWNIKQYFWIWLFIMVQWLSYGQVTCRTQITQGWKFEKWNYFLPKK